MISWWKRSLGRQIIGLMLIALVLGQCIGFALSWNSRRAALKEAAESEFVSRTSALCEVIQSMTEDFKTNVLLASATTYTRFWRSAEDPRPEGRNWYIVARNELLTPLSDMLKTPLQAATVSNTASEEFVQRKSFEGWSAMENPLWTCPQAASVLPFRDQIGLGIVVELADGSWLNAVFYKTHIPNDGTYQSLVSTVATGIALCLFGIFATRRIAQPLSALADAAEKIGRGEESAPVAERGPRDIARLCGTFNQMQERLRRFVEDRTQMLAAIGHDLRTPLTTMRLRVEQIGDPQLRDRLTETIDDMKSMTDATLSFARADAATEKTRLVDMGSLLESLCDDMRELGLDIDFEEADGISCRCRPDGIRRAVRNLVENACQYAGKASVSCKRTPSAVVITVADTGPGIPDADLEQVFLPFFRLEQSRNRDTGGTGLGLSIARAVARQHGGDIRLEPNKPGLRAVLTVPCQ